MTVKHVEQLPNLYAGSECAELVKAGRMTFQDLGRKNYQHIGITDGGAADKYAFCWANHLLGNPLNTTALESVLGAFEIKFNSAATAVVTGPKNKLFLNGKVIPMWLTFKLEPGDVLSQPFLKDGVYTYLAIAGGFKAEPVLNSCAVSVREQIGPNRGQVFSRGDTLSFTCSTAEAPTLMRQPHWRYIPPYMSSDKIRIIPNSAADLQAPLRQLCRQHYTLHSDSNKMGIRLNGEKIQQSARSILSEGCVVGTIQLPPSGQPIVLMAEHQTIGGYSKLATVYKADLHLLAQKRPGQKLSFSVGSLADAQASYQDQLAEFY